MIMDVLWIYCRIFLIDLALVSDIFLFDFPALKIEVYTS